MKKKSIVPKITSSKSLELMNKNEGIRSHNDSR